MDFSDEDRDVDIESDDEIDSQGKNSGQQFQTQGGEGEVKARTFIGPMKAEKRAHHNALERKRRDHIKDSFTGLRDSIPSLQGEKVASRAQILKRAAEYIQHMRKKNCNHQTDIEELKKQNQILESQIRTIEKAKTTGNFSSVNMMDNALVTNARGNSVSAFDGGSGSESSDSESSHHDRRKKMKTVSPATSSSGT